MKRLYFLRHAKSCDDDPSLRDIDRPINKRGKRDSQLIAHLIADNNYDIQHVFCSPAKRCRSTLKRVRPALNTPRGAISISDPLYTFESTELMAWLKDADNALSSFMIVGHNPALMDTIALLTGQPIHFPTCAFAKLELKVEYWDQLRAGCGTLIQHYIPRDSVV